MKKLLFIFFVMIGIIDAKPCMTDIYFGNGVWNDEDGAIKSRDYLKRFMLYKANVRLDPSKNEVDYRFGYVHNPSHGTFDDLIETFWQLKVNGQIDYGLFWAEAATLATLTGSIGETEIREKINQIVSQYNNDIIPILHAYQESFNQKHNVLLVAHSQGNLFGNKIYEMLSDVQKDKFRMISVATPANYVKIEGLTHPYVTAVQDYVINPIPGSLPGNVDGRGHTFLGTYLSVKGEGLAIDTGSIQAPRKIALYVKSAYDDLIQTATCDDIYDTVYLTLEKNTYTTLNVMGTNRENTPDIYDTLLSLPLEQVPVGTRCPYWEANYMCADEFNATHCALNLSEREGGMILSPLDIADYQYFKLSMLHGDECSIVDISDGIYDVVRDALWD